MCSASAATEMSPYIRWYSQLQVIKLNQIVDQLENTRMVFFLDTYLSSQLFGFTVAHEIFNLGWF